MPGRGDHIVLERTGDIAGRHPGDIPLPVPSFDGRSPEPAAPPSVAEQLHIHPPKTLDEVNAELAQAKADLEALIAKDKE